MTAIVIAPTTLTLTAGDVGSLTATLSTTGGTPVGGWTTTWQSSDASVVAVSASGALTAVSVGSATVTATAGGKSASAVVTVKPVITSVEASIPISKFVAVGTTRTLSVKVTSPSPAPAGGWTVGWTTSDPAVATVSQVGVLTAVAPGSVTITATVEGKSGSIAVEVLAQPGVVRLDLVPPDLTLAESEQAEVNAQVTLVGTFPAGGLAFTWTSSDPSIATVAGTGENGLVTGVKAGTATITATGYGKSSSATVTVVPKVIVPPPSGTVSAVGLEKPTVLLWPTAQSQVTALVTASVAEPPGGWPVVWTTGNAAVAAIGGSQSQYATVVGTGIGKTTLTALLDGKSATADVYVADLTSLTLSPSTLSIPFGQQGSLTTTTTTNGPLPPTGWGMSWTSSSPLVATVSPTGVVNAIGVGKTKIGLAVADEYRTAVITVTGTPPTLTLSTPDTLKGEIVATTSGYILDCIHKIRVTVSGPGVIVGTEVWESTSAAGPYNWTGISGWGQYAEGVPANDLVRFNQWGPVASPALLKPVSIWLKYHYAINASFIDLKTLATDNVATVNLVCSP